MDKAISGGWKPKIRPTPKQLENTAPRTSRREGPCMDASGDIHDRHGLQHFHDIKKPLSAYLMRNKLACQ